MPQYNTTPWFPNGDPLDPAVVGMPIKLLQRYVGDLNQIYDVLAWRLTNRKRLEDYYRTSKLGNPFTPWNYKWEFIIFQRFTLGIQNDDWFASEYSTKIYELYEHIRDKKIAQEDDIILEPEDLANYYTADVSSTKYSEVLITYFREDYDGSKALLYYKYGGFNYKVSFNIVGVLPYSVVVTSNNDDVASLVEAALPDVLLWKNFDIPKVEVESVSEIYEDLELLRSREETSVTTTEYFYSQQQRKVSFCGCYSQVQVVDEQSFNNIEAPASFCNDYVNRDTLQPQFIPPLADNVCPIWTQKRAGFPEDGFGAIASFSYTGTYDGFCPWFTLGELEYDYEFIKITLYEEFVSPVDKYWIFEEQEPVVNQWNDERILYFPPQDPDLPEFIHLSYANNNYWGMDTSARLDRGDSYRFYIPTGQTSINFSSMLPFRDDVNYYYTRYPALSSKCETITDTTNTDAQTTAFLEGGGASEFSNPPCTPQPVNTVEKDVFVTITSYKLVQCEVEISDEYKQDFFPLSFQQAIDTIDVYYFGQLNG